MSTKQYKQFKGLKKESLRDNMTNMEIALNMLAEASATELSKQRNPQGFNQQKRVAKTAFYKNREVNVRMKQRFVDDVASVTWVAKIAPSMLNVTDGKTVHEIS